LRIPKRTTLPYGLPYLQTDTEFMSGSHEQDGLGQNTPRRKRAMALARRFGVSTAGRYCPQLARYPGDPRAWIHGKEDVRRICREDGKGCEDLGVPLPEVDNTPKPYEVADDLVEREVSRIVTEEAGGDVTPKERADLKKETKTRLKGNME
jgi:hypothetical protein